MVGWLRKRDHCICHRVVQLPVLVVRFRRNVSGPMKIVVLIYTINPYIECTPSASVTILLYVFDETLIAPDRAERTLRLVCRVQAPLHGITYPRSGMVTSTAVLRIVPFVIIRFSLDAQTIKYVCMMNHASALRIGHSRQRSL